MKCKKCGKEFSEPVYPLHVKRCKVEKEVVVEEVTMEMKKDELIEIAEEKGVSIRGTKEDIINRIKEVE